MFLCLVSLLFILMEASMLILGDGDLVVYFVKDVYTRAICIPINIHMPRGIKMLYALLGVRVTPNQITTTTASKEQRIKYRWHWYFSNL